MDGTKQPNNDNGVYYFIGTITSHIIHALPLYDKLGGTFVVSSEAAKIDLAHYNVPVITVSKVNSTVTKQVDRLLARIGLKPTNLRLGRQHRKTFHYLEQNATIVIFYELFEFTRYTNLKKPKTLFLTHGNMLKSYMSNAGRRQAIKDYDYMAGLGPLVKQRLIENDGVRPDQLVDIGVARTDELHELKQDETLRARVTTELGVDPNKKIVTYMPTFWGPSSVYHTGKELLKTIDDSCLVFVKLHPQIPTDLRREYELIVNAKQNIIWADESHHPSLTLPKLLCVSDVFLGDLSSVVLEAVLVDIPMIFVYDIGEYRQKLGDYRLIRSIVDYSEYIDMTNVADVNGIINRSLERGIDKNLWKKTKNDIFYHHDGTSIMSIVAFIKTII